MSTSPPTPDPLASALLELGARGSDEAERLAALVRALRADGREALPVREIARLLVTCRSNAHRRVRRLVELGVLHVEATELGDASRVTIVPPFDDLASRPARDDSGTVYGTARDDSGRVLVSPSKTKSSSSSTYGAERTVRDDGTTGRRDGTTGRVEVVLTVAPETLTRLEKLVEKIFTAGPWASTRREVEHLKVAPAPSQASAAPLDAEVERLVDDEIALKKANAARGKTEEITNEPALRRSIRSQLVSDPVFRADVERRIEDAEKAKRAREIEAKEIAARNARMEARLEQDRRDTQARLHKLTADREAGLSPFARLLRPAAAASSPPLNGGTS